MEQIIEKSATWLGDAVSFLAESGVMFVVFALMWAAFGAALIWSQGSLDAAWQWVRSLPWIAQGAVWLLVLPVVLGLWIWQASWAVMVRLVLLIGVAGWTLLILPRPWR